MTDDPVPLHLICNIPSRTAHSSSDSSLAPLLVTALILTSPYPSNPSLRYRIPSIRILYIAIPYLNHRRSLDRRLSLLI